MTMPMVNNWVNSLVQPGPDAHSKRAISLASGMQNLGISHEQTEALPFVPMLTQLSKQEIFSRIVHRLVEAGDIHPSRGEVAIAELKSIQSGQI